MTTTDLRIGSIVDHCHDFQGASADASADPDAVEGRMGMDPEEDW
jgi:hypothetical protein